MKIELTKRKGVPPLLVFNSAKILVGIYASKSAFAKAVGTTKANVSYASNGATIACCGKWYVRELAFNIEVTFEDFHNLKLEEYDQMCGEVRNYYATSVMKQGAKIIDNKSKAKNKENKNTSDDEN